MTSRCGLLAVLGVLVLADGASAQFLVPGNPYGFGLTYTRVRPNSVLQLNLGARPFGYGCFPPFGPPVAPWGVNAINQTTVIVNPPAWNPFLGWPAYPRGVLVDPLAVEVLPPDFLNGGGIGREIDRLREALPRPLPDPNRGLLPMSREEDRVEVRIDRQPRPPVVREPARPAPPPVPRPDVPLADGQAEYLRLVTDGKVAFGKGEYGRAAERFGQAIDRRPADAPAWYLRSQANVALGKYLGAARDLREGLKRLPDGLVAGFVVSDLYGAKAAEYAEHRRLLDQARERFAGDMNLALLAAVQAWLAGDRADAVARMEKLPPAERALVAAFLAAGRVAAAQP